MATNTSPLLKALRAHQVSASVSDLDHYRIRGGMAVETDYIISVHPDEKGDYTFESFKISKTYSAFRTLASQLKRIVESACIELKGNLSSDVSNAVKFAESVSHLVDSQRTQYLGKVKYTYVKSLAKQRSQTINDTLDLILQNYPADVEGHDWLEAISGAIETFFLTDHCEEDEGGVTLSHRSPDKDHTRTPSNNGKKNIIDGIKLVFTPSTKDLKSRDEKEKSEAPTPPVVPLTRKTRRSIVVRAADDEQLQEVGDEANLMLDDDRQQEQLVPSYSAPVSVVRSNGTVLGDIIENNPYVFTGIAAAALAVLSVAQNMTVTIDSDMAMLLIFASFCLGLHMPRASQTGIDTAAVVPKPVVSFQRNKPAAARALLRASMMASPKSGMHGKDMWEASMEVLGEDEEEEVNPVIDSPMAKFPDGAALGSHLNCWSVSAHDTFHVRGPNYLRDKIKVPSGPFVFPARGVDLFLTDTCPENVGSNSGIMGGQLRDKPTFIINFRLPWGVLLLYFEIPEKFIPFVEGCYDPSFDESTLPSTDKMNAGDRTACRFLLGDESHKNETLKIVPVVVDGPWVVKSVVGGKPAIIGNKLPVNYVYQPKEGDKAMYLEADLDIVASSAARGILSVCRSYTQSLTLDLGFVVQGNTEDELPEQMLVGMRLHGIDPLNAPALPPMKNAYMEGVPSFDGDESMGTLDTQ